MRIAAHFLNEFIQLIIRMIFLDNKLVAPNIDQDHVWPRDTVMDTL
jgi:hypothetical protein